MREPKEINDFRLPTNFEKEKILKYWELRLKDYIKLFKRLTYVFIPILVIMLIGTIIDFTAGNIFITTIFGLCTLYCFRKYKICKKDIEYINEAEVLALDCTVSKIETNLRQNRLCKCLLNI